MLQRKTDQLLRWSNGFRNGQIGPGLVRRVKGDFLQQVFRENFFLNQGRDERLLHRESVSAGGDICLQQPLLHNEPDP